MSQNAGGVDQRFAEPVALSSAQPADRPLPRRAYGLGFNLVALRARREEEPNGSSGPKQVAFMGALGLLTGLALASAGEGGD